MTPSAAAGIVLIHLGLHSRSKSTWLKVLTITCGVLLDGAWLLSLFFGDQ